MTFRENSLYRVSPKSITKYGKCGYKFIYTLKHESVADVEGTHVAGQLSVNSPWIPKLIRIQQTVQSLILGHGRTDRDRRAYSLRKAFFFFAAWRPPKDSKLYPNKFFLRFVWFSEQAVIISLCSLTGLKATIEMECAYCAVRNDSKKNSG